MDGDTLDLSVANMGSDAVCFGGVIVRTASGDAMDCVMPVARQGTEIQCSKYIWGQRWLKMFRNPALIGNNMGTF